MRNESYATNKKFVCLGSVAGSVIQATGRMDFEDDLRTGIKLKVRNSLHSVRTIPEINMVSPLRLAMTLGAVWGQKFLCKSRGRPTSNLPSSSQSVVLNYSCYCGVRIELA